MSLCRPCSRAIYAEGGGEGVRRFRGQIMWAIDFCNRRSSDCIQMAEDCEDSERRRAWLDLAKEWVKLSEQVIASNYSGPKRTVGSETQGEAATDA